ncbi:pyridoxamine 5'-phosphate oxidase family protein [Sorangium sp. So ce124]|uniref:pyridoxamine 5'-phosphate oxidase family protein n=1 Tax=Sorangium sp. So ce124 TaxID=3133280 RepID=UPI003F61C514
MRKVMTAQQIEAIVGAPIPAVRMKQIGALDEGCRRVLANAPIAGFGFRDEQGGWHSTFVGGARGFVHVESPKRIRFELPARHPTPKSGSGASFVFLLPGIGETLRLNGSVAERRGGRIVVTVEEAFVHCARSILRSGLWEGPRAPAATAVEPPLPRDGARHEREGGRLGDPSVARFLASSPFAVVSSWDAAGSGDTSPRGDFPGFLRILDHETLVIPDRRGNRRTDTFHNVMTCSQVSLAAVVPGRDDVLHVSGAAYVTDEPALLSTMALAGKPPQAALVIRVERAELLANEALQRSKIWQRSAHGDAAVIPDLMALATQHLALNKGGGAKAAVIRMLGSGAGAFPRLLRWLIDLGYRKGLADEGYDRGAALRSGDEAVRPRGSRRRAARPRGS